MAEKKSNIDRLITEIESLTVLELNELVKALEKEFGVSAAAQSVAQAPPSGAPAGGESPAAEEKSEFTVELTEAGGQKIAVIKAVREINREIGLKEAKGLVESAPKIVAEGVKKEEAEEAKKKLEAAGAKVTLK